MPLRIYNTIKRSEELFKPLNPPNVTMYVCGVTPYDEAHLGHGRAYVVFDIVRRYLEYLNYKVQYVQNITDIDDKIITRANEKGVSIQELTEKYTDSFLDVMSKLNIEKPNLQPKATEHIKEMIEVIKGLVDKGFAYEVEGDVYFEVSKFKEYGKLSKRNLDDMKAGARVDVDKRKRSPLDFALWKTAKEGEPSWDSPWGKGRPGWHIECSTMSNKYLGETFDIHGGGFDLVFPHHENELAQAEAYTGKPFANIWMHNGFVTVNKEKMSKSLGNFFTLKDIFKKYKPEVVRFFLLSTHYKKPINFSDEELESMSSAYDRLRSNLSDLRIAFKKSGLSKKDRAVEIKSKEFRKEFERYMNNDFNSAGAIAVLHEIVKFGKNRVIAGDLGGAGSILEIFNELSSILGLQFIDEAVSDDVQDLVKQRDTARVGKDFKKSDEIRDRLQGMGYIVKDTPSGTSITKAVK